MWFKRRRKNEQDHALSESLRSLQSLLSEGGRAEPTLERRGSPAGDESPGGSEPARRSPEPAIPARAAAGDDAPPEPDVPESGSRWRDLNLSFDAEPIAPRRRDTEPDEDAEAEEIPETEAHAAETAPDAPAPLDAEPASDGETRETEADDGSPADVGEAELEAPVVHYDELAGPGVTYPADESPREDDAPPTFEGPDLEIDLADAETAVAGDGEEPALEDAPDGTSPTAADAPQHPGEAAAEPDPADGDPYHDGDRRREDQLDLELGPDEPTDDIPTLTDAVYVPPAPPDPDEPPGEAGTDPAADPAPVHAEPIPLAPGGSPHEERAERCIERLRVRLQLMDVAPLSNKQEKELQDTLVELLDELNLD